MKTIYDLKPVLSLLGIFLVILFLVFVKMEVRRLGYDVLKLSAVEKKQLDNLRDNEMKYASLTRPDRIEKYAQTHLELKQASRGQIIHLVPGGVALKQ